MRSPTATKRTIYFPGGRKRSVALEDAFWEGLKEIADRRQMTVSKLVAEIDAQRQHNNLSSAIRLHVLEFYRSQISERSEGEGVTGCDWRRDCQESCV